MLRLRTLGGIDLKDSQDRELHSLLAQPKRLALLVYLVAHNHHGSRRRDSVVALFWPELDTAHARGALRQALRFLRRTLGDDVLAGRSEDELALVEGALWSDSVAFEEACGSGQLVEALELYRGDFLDGFFVTAAAPEFEHWVEVERARLRGLAFQAARALADGSEARGDTPAAVHWSRRALELFPDSEETLQRLIALLDRLGDRAAAIHAYEEFAGRLVKEHEIEPSAETQAVMEAIRSRVIPGSTSLFPRGVRLLTGIEASPVPRRRRKRPAVLIALAVLAFGGWFTISRTQRHPVADPPPTSVAVLYFTNLSRDSLDAYLVDGLSEEITSRLGQISRLQVKSRSAVRRFRDDTLDDVGAIGRKLGVRFLVEGSLRREGQQVRVAVRLINAANGFRVWGADFDRGTTDLLALQIGVAGSVATSIAGRLLPAELASLAARSTRNLDAYDHYLRGNYYLAQRTQRSVTLAIQEYDVAARLDSGFTMALARGAYGKALFLNWGWVHPKLSPVELLGQGFAAADRALAQDSGNSDAWMARAYLLTIRHSRTYDSVPAAFERAIALDPQNAEASHQYAWVLAQLGRDSAAIAANLRALAIDPERAITLAQLGEVSMARGRLYEASRWFDSSLAVDPAADYARSDRTFVRMWLGDTAGARVDALWLHELALLAMLDGQSGDMVEARSRIHETLGGMGGSGVVTLPAVWDLSMALIAVGEWQRSFELLGRVRPRGPSLWFLLRMPGFDAVRSHPQFRRLIEQSRPPVEAVSLQ